MSSSPEEVMFERGFEDGRKGEYHDPDNGWIESFFNALFQSNEDSNMHSALVKAYNRGYKAGRK